MARRTPRENAILMAGLCVAVVAGYGLIRYKPRARELAAAKAELQSTQDKLNAVRIPPEPLERPDQLNQEVQKLAAQRAEEQARLTEVGRQFAPTDEDVRQLNVEIASLAENCGVRIKASKPMEANGQPIAAPAGPGLPTQGLPEDFPAELRPGAKKPTDVKAEPKPKTPAPIRWSAPFIDKAALGRFRSAQPLEQMELECNFVGLRRFLDGLSRLRWRVTVVEMDVAIGQRPDGFLRSPLLRTTIVLSL